LIDFILDEENLNSIINAALEIILVVTEGLVKAIPQLVDAAIQIIEKLCDFFLDPENISMLLDMAFKIVVAIVEGLGKATSELVKGVGKLIENIFSTFKKTDWESIGKNIINGLKTGISNAWSSLKTSISNIWTNIKNVFSTAFSSFSSIGSNIVSGIKAGINNAWSNLKTWFANLFGDLIGIAKKILGIKSPSRVFRDEIGKQMAAGLAVGWDDEFSKVKKEIENSLVFDDASMRINASVAKPNGAFGGSSRFGNVSIVQNIYSEAKTAADLMQEALYQQEKAVLLGV
jgi:phage-related protein